MTDYLGNEILEGMEICWVLINKYKPVTYWCIGSRREIMQGESNEPCWEVGEYATVKMDSNGRPFITTVTNGSNHLEGYTFNFKTYLDSPFIDTTNLVLAIKGVSDKQNEKETKTNPNRTL